MRARTRLLLGGLGLTLLLAGVWVSLISVIVGVVPQSPNPYVSDGDPCCGIPDTWAETRAMAFWGLLWLIPALLISVTGVLLIVGAIRGRRLRWRWLPVGVAVLAATAGAAIVIAYLRLEEVPQMTRCREASAMRSSYRFETRARRETLASRIVECRMLAGRSVPEVINMLGPPVRTEIRDHGVRERWYYGPRLIAVEIEHQAGRSWVGGVWITRDG